MSDPSADETSRMSKARQRHLKRKQRQQARETRRTTPTSERRALPVGSDRKPVLNMRLLRPILLGVGAVAFMLALIVGVGLFTSDPAEPDPNAIWLGTDWSYQAASNEDRIRGLINRMERNQIGVAYARVSELNFDGTWTGIPQGSNRFDEVEPNVVAFAETFKRLAPDRELLGTVVVRSEIGGNYRLDQETVQRVIEEFCARVVHTMGYDGVLLVVEPVWNGDEDYLDLIRRVRQSIGDDATFAVAVPPDWTPTDAGIPITDLIAPDTVWDREYKQRVALRGVDVVVVQAYNSYLTTDDDYREWMAYQVSTYAEAIGDLETSTRVLVGVPTYASFELAHDERIENVVNAVAGIIQGLEDAGDLAWAVSGVAIYAEWDTDETEWEQFYTEWVTR